MSLEIQWLVLWKVICHTRARRRWRISNWNLVSLPSLITHLFMLISLFFINNPPLFFKELLLRCCYLIPSSFTSFDHRLGFIYLITWIWPYTSFEVVITQLDYRYFHFELEFWRTGLQTLDFPRSRFKLH